MTLVIVPTDLDEANRFVRQHHRHSRPVRGQKWSAGVANGKLCGVAISGMPRARALDDGFTVEIYRVCTDGTRNACTKLYASQCQAAKALGFRLAITYTLKAEGGASLKAAGFKPVAEVKDRQWNCPARPREERDLIGDKVRWERAL